VSGLVSSSLIHSLKEPFLAFGQEQAKWPFSLQLKHLMFFVCISPVGVFLGVLFLTGVDSGGL